MLPTGDAFVASGAPAEQHGAQTALRGAASALAQPTSVRSAPAFPTIAGAATGIAVMGSLAGAVVRGAGHRRRAAKVVRNFNKEQQLGAQDPLGFWDPLGYCKDEASFRDYRIKELKHGRLAMTGALGMLTQSLVQVPGMEGVPKSVSAIFVGNGLPWFDDYSEEMRARELNNGRIAMFAAMGQIAAGLYTGKDAIEQLGL